MANLNINDSVQVTINGLLLGQRTMNNFYYRITALTGTVDNIVGLTAFYTSLSAANQLLARHLLCCPSNWQRTQVWLQVIKPSRLRRVTINDPENGGGPGPADTANIQGSVTRVGDLATRRDVGGVRIPVGTTSDSINSGFLTPELKNQFEDLAAVMNQQYLTITPAITFTPMITIPADGQPWVRVQSAFAQDTVRVLRRRTVGLGI